MQDFDQQFTIKAMSDLPRKLDFPRTDSSNSSPTTSTTDSSSSTDATMMSFPSPSNLENRDDEQQQHDIPEEELFQPVRLVHTSSLERSRRQRLGQSLRQRQDPPLLPPSTIASTASNSTKRPSKPLMFHRNEHSLDWMAFDPTEPDWDPGFRLNGSEERALIIPQLSYHPSSLLPSVGFMCGSSLIDFTSKHSVTSTALPSAPLGSLCQTDALADSERPTVETKRFGHLTCRTFRSSTDTEVDADGPTRSCTGFLLSSPKRLSRTSLPMTSVDKKTSLPSPTTPPDDDLELNEGRRSCLSWPRNIPKFYGMSTSTSDTTRLEFYEQCKHREATEDDKPRSVLKTPESTATRNKMKWQNKNSYTGYQRRVRFAYPLVTQYEYRPKTRREDVRRLFFQEDELREFEMDRFTTFPERFECVIQTEEEPSWSPSSPAKITVHNMTLGRFRRITSMEAIRGLEDDDDSKSKCTADTTLSL